MTLSRTAPFALLLAALLIVVAAGCRTAPLPASAPAVADTAHYYPSIDLGPLFADVQLGGVFADSKTFVDARPLAPPGSVVASYRHLRDRPDFELSAFVRSQFALPDTAGAAFEASGLPMLDHLHHHWTYLTRAADVGHAHSSLLPLPHPYVVPGGRFREIYYWDSYFTMLGLDESGRMDLVRHMLDNFAHLVRTAGHIPNGNRTYYLSRSQPPFFAAMLTLLMAETDTAAALPYLDALRTEHAFWMDGADRLAQGSGAYRRVVRVGDVVLNRYWDDRARPRPESFREDYTLAQRLPKGERAALYRNLRAAAESGWDFSSRWMDDPDDLATLRTTHFVPVDLNALLYHQERTLAALYRQAGRPENAALFDRQARARRDALLALTWDPANGFFSDYDRQAGRPTGRLSMATVYPLYFGLADSAQAASVARMIRSELLRPGGFVTTTVRSGQQWDAPNGWAPLQWLAIQGLRRYGHDALADTARARWLRLNQAVYGRTGKMMEKYDVTDLTREAGGGEYPLQDGFGWTNGVALALLADSLRAPR